VRKKGERVRGEERGGKRKRIERRRERGERRMK
jgi:hypothetical protein